MRFQRPVLSLAMGALIALSVPGTLVASISDDDLREILIHEQTRNFQDGVLIDFSKDRKDKVRIRAFQAMGRIQDVELLEPLAKGLKDRKETVRLEAAFAIGQLFDPAAEPAIREALKKEKSEDVRDRLIEGLGKCGTSESVAYLAELVGSEDQAAARTAAIAIGIMAYRDVPVDAAGEALRKALMSPDPELQWRAAFAVYRGEVRGAFSSLQRALKSKDPLVLIYSCKAAAALRNKTIGESLIPLFDHEDWRVRVEALNAIAELRARFETSMASLLLDDPNEHVRLVAIRTMGMLSGGGGLGRIEHLEGASDWRVRAEILKARARGSGDGALLDLKLARKDPDWRIRQATAEALGMVRSEQAVILMEGLLNDESPQVLTAVVNALVGFPHRQAVEYVRPFIDSGDPALLTSAANFAGERFDYEAVVPLMAAYERLQSPVDVEPMVAILESLGAILMATEDNDPIGTLLDADRAKAEALLESARNDTDINIAGTAAEVLSNLRGETVEPANPPTPQLSEHFDLEQALEFEKSGPLTARLITSRGTIVVRLLGAQAPGTVSNFVTLAQRGYFNGLTFHRVVPDFVIQGGDPRGDGWGGPGYSIRCEYNTLRFREGMMGMALAGKDTGGSQFFITHSPQPHLDGRFTIFGEVIEGMDVVNAILVGDLIDEVQLEGI